MSSETEIAFNEVIDVRTTPEGRVEVLRAFSPGEPGRSYVEYRWEPGGTLDYLTRDPYAKRPPSTP